MSEAGYRALYHIQLPPGGLVPPDPLNTLEFDSSVELLQTVWGRSLVLDTTPNQITQKPLAISQQEIARSWKCWHLSHYAFCILSELLSHSYQQIGIVTPDRRLLHEWARRISSLWAAAGGLMIYGCDFEPLEQIYGGILRPQMPPAFSGFWLREWNAVYSAMVEWNQYVTLHSEDKAIAAASETIKQGLKLYHQHHFDVMRRAVPDGTSLAAQYKQQHDGCPHQVTEDEFACYDSWFHIERSVASRELLLPIAVTILNKVMTDIAAGHYFAPQIIHDITHGVRAAIEIFGGWLGCIPETSRFYHKSLRGE